MKIALDAMGGDFGPPNLVTGAVMALHEYRHINKLFLVGDTEQIESELKKQGCNDRRIEIVHSTQVVDMSDRAWSAVRRKKDSSVSRAVDLVKRGDADAVVSAGHTGAAVAASMIKLRTLEGVDRPGLRWLLRSDRLDIVSCIFLLFQLLFLRAGIRLDRADRSLAGRAHFWFLALNSIGPPCRGQLATYNRRLIVSYRKCKRIGRLGLTSEQRKVFGKRE